MHDYAVYGRVLIFVGGLLWLHQMDDIFAKCMIAVAVYWIESLRREVIPAVLFYKGICLSHCNIHCTDQNGFFIVYSALL
jgi:hypothetical protein